MRLADRSGRYLWCKMRITLQSLEGESRRRAVGVIIDIDAVKRQTQRLRRLAEQDILTGIYNRGTAQDLIIQRLANLKPGESSALFLLDVDDFKQINDQYGHLGGDAVLTNVASVLQRTFRAGDIVGRMGGDEFCVFLSGVWDRSVLAQKADDVLRVFRRLLTRKGRRSFSCSIGIAVSPEDGTDYVTLFRNADVALYRAKETGKNGYSFYQQRINLPGTQEEPTLETDPEETAMSDESMEDLESAMFHLLYKADNLEKSLPLLLEMLGREMAVSRVSLYELQEDGRHVWNSFEWCALGIPSKKQSWGYLDMQEMRRTASVVKREGMLYGWDTACLPAGDESRLKMEYNGIRTALYYAIRDGDEIVGAIGFDNCRDHNDWTREQVEGLALASDIVGAFLIRYREKERAELQVEGLIAALDCQEAWIYVIDSHTSKLLHANEMARKLLPGLRIGEKCCENFSCAELPARCLMKVPSEGQAGFLLRGLSDRNVEMIKKTIPWAGNRTAYLISFYPMEKNGGSANYD